MAEPTPPPLTDAELAEILACDVTEARRHGHEDWAVTMEELVAEVRRLRADRAQWREWCIISTRELHRTRGSSDRVLARWRAQAEAEGWPWPPDWR